MSATPYKSFTGTATDFYVAAKSTATLVNLAIRLGRPILDASGFRILLEQGPEAALAVAIRKGFGTTTVRDVANELGCSSGLIHHYFDSMDEVLAAAFELAAGRDLVTTEAAVAAELTPVGQLMAFFASYSRTDQDWSFQLWLDAWSEAARQPAVGATSRRLNVAWQQLLAEIVVRGNAAGEFRCDDPEAAAWRIVSMIDGLVSAGRTFWP